MAYTVAEYFANRKNQFHKNILGRITRGNPFRPVIPMSPFDLSEGEVPTVITQTHMLPSAYPTALTQVPTPSVAAGVSNDTSAPGCNPTPTVIQTGHKERTFRLYGESFKTPVFCLSDMKRKSQVVEQVRFMERALGNFVNVWFSDYCRIQNVAMADNKLVTLTNSGIGSAVSLLADHSAVSELPTEYAGWGHLKKIYWEMVRGGVAEELAVGSANGLPVIPVFASPNYIERWTRDDTGDKVKTTIDYYDPKSNLKALGYRESINGFLFIPDLFPIRYGDADGIASKAELVAAKMIYPTVNDTSITAGVGHKPNPNWMTTGQAEYEVITFLPKNVWEMQYEPVDPTMFAGMNFNPKTDYIGTFKFINTPTFDGANDRGNMGYYLADIRVAAKPKYTDLGYSLLTKALD